MNETTLRELVERYLDAWNRRDAAGVLELFHPGAVVYDALWRESCMGRHLPKYIRDGLEEDEYFYQLTDDLIYFDKGVLYRYAAYEWDGSEPGDKRFEGAEVVTVRDGKILTLSNYYCDPDPKVLREVAKLSVSRHGIPSYVASGNGAYKHIHVKNRFLDMMSTDDMVRDRSLTVASLAEKVGCSVDDLLTLVEEEFGIDTGKDVGQEDMKYVVDLFNP